MANNCCFFNRLTSVTYTRGSVHAFDNAKSVSINESIDFETSHAGGNIGPVCREVSTYDLSVDVSYECICGTPVPKSSDVGVLDVTIVAGFDNDIRSANISVAGLLAGGFSMDLTNGSAMSAKQSFVYRQETSIGSLEIPITVSAC